MAEALITAALDQVELFEDRAAVVRLVPLPAGPGRHVLRVGPLSPLLHEARLSLGERPGVELESMALHRALEPRAVADPARVAALRARAEDLEARVEAARSAARRAGEAAERARGLAETSGAWASLALLQEDDPAAWVELLAEQGEGATRRALDALDARQALTSLELELAIARRDLALASAGRSRRHVVLELRVLISGEGGGALPLRYTLPCALWRPVHEAELGGGRLTWTLGAMAWNATGEDWAPRRLVFSTERPGEAASPPELQDDLLRARPRAETLVVEARDEAVQVARQGQREARAEVLGVDDGGQVRVFEAPGAARLPSDGRPVHVPLSRFEGEARPTWVAFPEQDALVHLRTRQVNGAAQPLLAGPVVLKREGERVGRARVRLVPPGEPFDLGWGTHDDLILTRRQDAESSQALLTGRRRLELKVSIRLANLGREAVELEVHERVPVSELKEVEVSAPKATPPLSEGPDADGRLCWRLRLGPGEQRDLSLSVQLDASAKVALPW